MGRTDILTGKLGKALAGASGGYTSGGKEIVELLRQRSRPYLFSNTMCPSIVGGSIAALDMLKASTTLRDQLETNTRYFREKIASAGFSIVPGEHPIVRNTLGGASLASRFADAMLERGIYVIGFSYPVVAKGKARIRTQISAPHTREELDRAVNAFIEVRDSLGI